MKQVVQSLKTGVVEVLDTPLPQVGRKALRIRSSMTLISAGTERMMMEFGRGNWIQKARQQPDKVRMVLDKAKTDGIAATLQGVRNKLDQPLAPGYCNVGVVDACGSGVDGFAVGDRVASNGKHAEYVVVSGNLCARIPDNVPDEDAVFAVVGAIALQGIRLAQVALGETVAVMGLGLIGLLGVQLLRAQGCRVIGMDYDPAKIALARSFGAETVLLGDGADPVQAAMDYSRGRGVDAVIITAATDSNDPVHHGAQMSRKRGRIVLVGVTGLELSRADFFEKELTFQVSCSYGPGRYDPVYEEQGVDYPVGFVRWTEQRNFEAVLDMMSSGALDCAPLRSHSFDIAEAAAAYEVIGGQEPSLGVLLRYPQPAGEDALQQERLTNISYAASEGRSTGEVAVNVIGAGNYASAVLLPAFAGAGARLRRIASSGGLTATHQAKKHGFLEASTDSKDVLTDPDADAVVITTRHDSHADLTRQALAAGKHVFVEKPLALALDDVDSIVALAGQPGAPIVMVGFNRRFAPLVVQAKARIDKSAEPCAFIYTVNAGQIPPEHWTQDKEIGGGRLVGECCHFIDLLRFLAGAPVAGSSVVPMQHGSRDTFLINLHFENGSVGSINYLANGNRSFPKERIEIFQAGKVVQIDNFRQLRGYGWKAPGSLIPSFKQDKGQAACAKAFLDAIRTNSPSPIPLEELAEVARLSIRLAAQV
ncbi:bi-domain-containing oxidoreductase [Sphingomonas sp. DG1-23]|uniref:bi-domain-containing oxidoreductase n=1 Tax=Sphingomonas sp. DG1-23 TaxID=3068316 RepID=UPI00273FB7F7|nr:bi-domain-containing oxidoreductase [Sphingomonas sp. DG1-23]MDP5280674.1 bi-domain-containing oxidoreductase [Sphingomonas sp. DG1-23]